LREERRYRRAVPFIWPRGVEAYLSAAIHIFTRFSALCVEYTHTIL
jgi:hypothetical protein